jgi:hypothetical protein
MTGPLNEADLTELCIRDGGFCCRNKNPEALADVVITYSACRLPGTAHHSMKPQSPVTHLRQLEVNN